MKLTQNHIEHLIDRVQRGEITADQANVEKVRMARVQIVSGRIPATVRRALNDAVRRGDLRHVTKNGKKPEAYFHPDFEYLANAARNKHEQEILTALAAVCGAKCKAAQQET